MVNNAEVAEKTGGGDTPNLAMYTFWARNFLSACLWNINICTACLPMGASRV
jgi:hypothetical protein